MIGSLVNAATILVGGAIGLFLGNHLPSRLQDTVMKGLGLCTLFIGISGLSDGEELMITVLSMVFGSLLGELLDLDGKLQSFGEKLEQRVSSEHTLAQGFLTASLLFCIGAMAITGSITEGLTGNADILLTKATMDGIASLLFASSLGLGVLLSSIPVLVIQGSITLLASVLAPVLEPAMNEINCVGSLLLVGLSFNLMGIGHFKVMNYVPAIFIPILLCPLW